MSGGGELVVPGTGEIVNLDDPAAASALWHQLKRYESQSAELRRLIADRLGEEALERGTKTLHFDGVGRVRLVGGPESETVWDIPKLRAALRAAGLPSDRLEALIKTRPVEWYVDGNVAKQLSSNPRYRVIIEACKTKRDKPWRIE